MPLKVLVTGGVRSGKSAHAEALLARAPRVTYVAPGYAPDPEADPEWAARVAAHRAARLAHWDTLETPDVAAAVAGATTALLVDCLGTWLTRQLDDLDAWTQSPRLAGARSETVETLSERGRPRPRRGVSDWEDELRGRIRDLATAWAASDRSLVAVTNEVGMGLVSEHRSGRVFADWLGRTNQAIAAASDEVHLVVAGRVLIL